MYTESPGDEADGHCPRHVETARDVLSHPRVAVGPVTRDNKSRCGERRPRRYGVCRVHSCGMNLCDDASASWAHWARYEIAFRSVLALDSLSASGGLFFLFPVVLMLY